MGARTRLPVGGLILALLVIAVPQVAPAAVTVNGAGSTDSYIAINQWQADVARDGISVNYTANGEAGGHFYYVQGQSDFSVAAIPFDAEEAAQAADRPYRYIPLVASGTAFMYNLDVDGTRVDNLKLSPTTLARIFTGQIRNWDDPQIAADNGRAFPDLAITPVIRSDGYAGSSLRLSEWFAQRTPRIWRGFCRRLALATCAPTALYPSFPGSVGQSLSDGVASYVETVNGAITYVEDSDAKERGFPVASVRNPAGRYVQPDAPNVTTALKDATSLADGTPVFSGVYASRRPSAYPLSSYEFMIVPTTTAAPFSTDKGDQLAQFLRYALCHGQVTNDELGYAALPALLVRDALRAVSDIPGAAPQPPTC